MFDAERTGAFGSNSLTYLTPTQGELVSYGTTAFQNNQLGLGRIFGASATTDILREPSGAQVSQRVSGAKRYFLTERLGSTTGLLDSASGGSIDRAYTYDPDGDPSSGPSGATTDILFAGGHRLDPAAVYHFGRRYYAPATARWTQPDPLKHDADLKQANLYTYAGCDPINMTDETGTSIFGDAADVVNDVGNAVAGFALGCVFVGVQTFETGLAYLHPYIPIAGCLVGGAVGAYLGYKYGPDPETLSSAF